MKLFFFAALCAIFFSGCDNPCKNCGCDNVDDCLSKYKFEEARKYVSHVGLFSGYNGQDRSNYMFKIIISEVNYWISQNELKRAEAVSKEMLLVESVDHSKEDLNRKYAELNLDIIRKYCELGQIEGGENLVNMLPQKLCIEKVTISITGNDHLTKQKKSTESCLTTYNNYKKTLKVNQEIEPFNLGSYDFHGWDCYVVSTYSFTREEALEILKSCK